MIEISKNILREKVTLRTVKKNGIFGEMTLIDEAMRTATASALIETVCILVPKIAMQAHLADADPLSGRLPNVLRSNVRSLSDHITHLIEEDN
jgi:CRP/FNR family cyclic AMP-dependent transcriptional regulator